MARHLQGIRDADDHSGHHHERGQGPGIDRPVLDRRRARVAIDRTELVLATGTMVARLVTTYRDDGRLGMAVPVEMREEYTDRGRRADSPARDEGHRLRPVPTTSGASRSAPNPRSTARAPQTPLVASVVRRAGEYVTRFAQAFSNVVTEEHYVQNVSAGVPSGMLRSGGRRDLRSDLLLDPRRRHRRVAAVPRRVRGRRLAGSRPRRAAREALQSAHERARRASRSHRARKLPLQHRQCVCGRSTRPSTPCSFCGRRCSRVSISASTSRTKAPVLTCGS